MDRKVASHFWPDLWSARLGLYCLELYACELQGTPSHMSCLPYPTCYMQDRFYIFDLARLRQLQTEALDKHGNNTRAVVDDIVGHLKQEMPDYAISSTEEWVSRSLIRCDCCVRQGKVPFTDCLHVPVADVQ